jgi:hypothetical protein
MVSREITIAGGGCCHDPNHNEKADRYQATHCANDYQTPRPVKLFPKSQWVGLPYLA